MYLDVALVQTIDGLENGRVGKGQSVGSYPNNISVFGVECLESNLWSLAVDINESPPIRQRSEEGSRVLVQAMMIAIFHKPSQNQRNQYQHPVTGEVAKKSFNQAVVHVENKRTKGEENQMVLKGMVGTNPSPSFFSGLPLFI
jgi:hypothetical protein